MADRPAAVAATFYEGDSRALRDNVGHLLAAAGGALANPNEDRNPKVLIAPHAGHAYSGEIAASVYARLINPDRIRRVVLLGPSHRVGFRGIATSTASHYRTPLGVIPLAPVSDLAGLDGVGALDDAHAEEHSLEVHLPFLQVTLGTFELLPLVVGDASPDLVAAVIDRLWGDDATLIVVSTDLSHFHDHATASALDRRTADRIAAFDDTLRGEDACGARPVNGLLRLARRRELEIEEVDVRNSGDTTGDRSRVVGYGGWALFERVGDKPSRAPLDRHEQALLLQVARDSIVEPLNGNKRYRVELGRFPASLKALGASFVTLEKQGQLRGCIGSLVAHRELVADVAHNAQSAAFRDPRFPGLTLAEYAQIDLHISVLSAPEPFPVESREALIDALRPGVDGLILSEGGRRATYLPSVWSQLPEPDRFVSELRRKAGLSPDGWSPQTVMERYTTFEFS